MDIDFFLMALCFYLAGVLNEKGIRSNDNGALKNTLNKISFVYFISGSIFCIAGILIGLKY